jgi:hypothetical protein
MRRRGLLGLLPVLLGSLMAVGVMGAKPAQPDPVMVAAGDVAVCGAVGAKNTSVLIDQIPGTVLAVGDLAYENGTTQEFQQCYDPYWGRFRTRTRPAPGNHEYNTPNATPYYTYFAGQVPDNTGYYSFDLGAWHIISLNSNIPVNAGSVQEQWLRADLAAHPATCVLAYWHHPRFSSGTIGNNAAMQPLWQALYDYHADVVIGGHDHDYERFAPQNPVGQADPGRGIRAFVVGTGGAPLTPFLFIRANSQFRANHTWGVLKLTLQPTGYQWEFVPVNQTAALEAGSGTCVP